MINLTILRRLHGAATEGPWAISLSGLHTNDGALPVMDGSGERVALVDLVAPCPRSKMWQAECPERDANAALIALAPDIAAAVLAHPAALRAALIWGYEIARDSALYGAVSRADKCAALQAALKEYPDETA